VGIDWVGKKWKRMVGSRKRLQSPPPLLHRRGASPLVPSQKYFNYFFLRFSLLRYPSGLRGLAADFLLVIGR
jgi:hypothetical protein